MPAAARSIARPAGTDPVKQTWSTAPEPIKRRLKEVGLWDVDPANLFRIGWKNEPVERGGVLQGIEGQAEARSVPGITGLSITIPIGQAIRPLPRGDRYLGFLFAEGDDAAAVERALRLANGKLRTVIL